jgi:eukaryotic-like serine/threonine-protein kinase
MDATLDSPKAAPPALGTILANKYELVSVLGQGGMGVVYEALHRKLGQRFAVKMLRAELMDDEKYVARFEREARLAARLRSEHTVRIFDVDSTPSGVPYMVMELLDGRDLAGEVDARGDVPPSELVVWMRQVCLAVQEAHDAGVIHRDLKPSNVFLCTAGDRTIAKVLDFGISKALHGSAGDLTATTTQDGVVGTPRYMSPEQVRGAEKIDGRSDIWAIGVMMYRVLAGTYPFDGASGAQIAVAIANDTAVNLRVHRPELPGSLVAIVMKALAKRPEDRFASAAELANALEPLCNVSTPTRARTSTPPASLASVTVRGLTSPTLGDPPPTASPRRSRWALLGAFTVVLAVLGVAIPLVASRARSAGRHVAVEPAPPVLASVALPPSVTAPAAVVQPLPPAAAALSVAATAPPVSADLGAPGSVVPAASPPTRKAPERRPKSRPAPPASAAPSTSAVPASDPLHL